MSPTNSKDVKMMKRNTNGFTPLEIRRRIPLEIRHRLRLWFLTGRRRLTAAFGSLSLTGFTIIELMVASGILVSLLAVFLGSFHSLGKASDYSRGLALAFASCRSKLEELISHDFAAIKTDYSAGGTPGNTFAFNPTTDITGIGNITITDRQDVYGGGENQATAAADWLIREDHASLVCNGKMWVLGGLSGGGSGSRTNDVWWTDDLNFVDGQTWTPVTTNTPMWSGREDHASLVYNNRMWVLGGLTDIGYSDEIWYSLDGQTWIQAPAGIHWSVRSSHATLVYNNRMWVLGGKNSAGAPIDDIWYSTDGISWTQAPALSHWSPRYAHTALVYNNEMWVLGGIGAGYKNDVWHSPDGIIWTQAIAAADWPARDSHTSLVYDNKMWVLGGTTAIAVYKNDVWYSQDGINWTLATAAADWSARQDHTSLLYNNKMWVLGGLTGVGRKNDVWYSAGYDRVFEVVITLCWQQRDGRIFGEDANLNGTLDASEDSNSNGVIDSPAQLRILISEKNISGLRKMFLGRP